MSTSVLEMPRLKKAITLTQQVPAAPPPQPEAAAGFTEEEIESFHRDDAMTAGMIAVILGTAFSVLLVLVVGVTAWMMTISG